MIEGGLDYADGHVLVGVDTRAILTVVFEKRSDTRAQGLDISPRGDSGVQIKHFPRGAQHVLNFSGHLINGLNAKPGDPEVDHRTSPFRTAFSKSTSLSYRSSREAWRT